MLRSDIINQLLKLFESPKYLEIGVWRGDTFHAVLSNNKSAVDPSFQFDKSAPEYNSPGISYFEQTSNAYFSDHPSNENKFDLIFLDGLHTFEQTLTDLLHAVDRLRDDGIIIIDDVIPDSYPASMRSEADCYNFRLSSNDPGTHWMGDVYKLVFFIDTFFLNWTYYTVAETHGQVVMWRKPRLLGQGGSELVAQTYDKSYADAVLARSRFNIRPLGEIIWHFVTSGKDGARRLKADGTVQVLPTMDEPEAPR